MGSLADQLQRIEPLLNLDLEHMRVVTLSEVFEEFHLLRALEVKRLQLWAVAFWKWHQIGFGLGPVGIHGSNEG